MNRAVFKTLIKNVATLLLLLVAQGCSSQYQLTNSDDSGMERYAEERYAQALLYMETSRYELAQQQFSIVEKTAVSEELHQLGHDGYNKAAAVIKAKR